MRHKTMSLLIGDLEAVAEHHNPHRDGVLQLVLEYHAERYGPGVPIRFDSLNGVLATYGQPLTNQAEIDVFYSRKVPARQCN